MVRSEEDRRFGTGMTRLQWAAFKREDEYRRLWSELRDLGAKGEVRIIGDMQAWNRYEKAKGYISWVDYNWWNKTV